MNKETFTSALLLVSTSATAISCVSSEAAKAPNVIYILADDLGYADLSCYGQTNFATPNIDAMAKGGMRFTQFYAGCTVSAPSRCALLTGKHTGHTFVRGNKDSKCSDGRKYDYPIPSEEYTLGEMFKSQGYTTACVGKWGLGGIGTTGHPNNQGFDYFYGYLGQRFAHKYYPQFLHENSELIELNGESYSHDLIEDKAVEFIKENKDNPFFLYLTFTIPHAELAIPDEYSNEYEGKFEECEPFMGKSSYGPQEEPHKVFASMVTRLDQSVGTILALLEELGIEENTMVVFTSDNGAHAEGGADPEFFNSTGIYRGIKRDLYEGGIRIPMIISYPEVVEAGSESDFMGAFWDFMPTFAELIGVERPEGSDGVSIVPTLKGKTQKEQHEYLYWEFDVQGGRQALRMGDWKLIRHQWKKRDKSYYELFNVIEDPSEKSNVVEENPQLVEQMKTIMDSARVPSEIYD